MSKKKYSHAAPSSGDDEMYTTPKKTRRSGIVTIGSPLSSGHPVSRTMSSFEIDLWDSEPKLVKLSESSRAKPSEPATVASDAVPTITPREDPDATDEEIGSDEDEDFAQLLRNEYERHYTECMDESEHHFNRLDELHVRHMDALELLYKNKY